MKDRVYNYIMDYFDEVSQELSKLTANVSQDTIDIIKLSERIQIFEKLRYLIHEKDQENDEIAAAILGWAYERLAQD